MVYQVSDQSHWLNQHEVAAGNLSLHVLHSIIQWNRIRAYCALLYRNRKIVDIAGTEHIHVHGPFIN
jgi:hypothetical protein